MTNKNFSKYDYKTHRKLIEESESFIDKINQTKKVKLEEELKKLRKEQNDMEI